ncbi:hypothetical protein [Orrella marina]|uniref:Uncharacterized protein n=1 Tax=Orrella marina TaxID=2163011 RepID=A0A2R4XG98_9BURK|nr:hypothetical protein [Orrella marina]AWB32759.1 hypothetical protein DBV39_02410 [Orrella marina]
MTATHENPKTSIEHLHVVRSGIFRSVRRYWLEGEFFCWSDADGQNAQSVSLADVSSLRIQSRTAGMQSQALCYLTEKSGRRHLITDLHWQSRAERKESAGARHALRSLSYWELVSTIIRRLRLANPDALYLKGPSKIEWISTIVVAIASVLIVVIGLYLMISEQTYPFHVIGFIAMAAVYLPLLWPTIESGGPKPFDPESI